MSKEEVWIEDIIESMRAFNRSLGPYPVARDEILTNACYASISRLTRALDQYREERALVEAAL